MTDYHNPFFVIPLWLAGSSHKLLYIFVLICYPFAFITETGIAYDRDTLINIAKGSAGIGLSAADLKTTQFSVQYLASLSCSFSSVQNFRPIRRFIRLKAQRPHIYNQVHCCFCGFVRSVFISLLFYCFFYYYYFCSNHTIFQCFV